MFQIHFAILSRLAEISTITYQDFCNTVFTAAKRSILCSSRNNCRPGRDEKCKHLSHVFLQARQGELLVQLQLPCFLSLMKNKKCWSKTIISIDFTDSSRQAWIAICNLTGWTRYIVPHLCQFDSFAVGEESSL